VSYQKYLSAERLLNEGLIRRNLSIEREGKKPRDPLLKMAAMRAFLDDCHHPEQGIPAIHVAGTSGKGSVSAAVAGILHEAGFKVGLHVSPYLQAATEKIWIGGRLVSADTFESLVHWVIPKARSRLNPDTPASIHGMASVAIALEAFRREAVDVMVFEAGCGGRYDLSNVLETCVAVVTNVGLDHLLSLGPDIEQIAWHKAGIAKPDVPLVTGATGRALTVIAKEAETIGAPVLEVPPVGDAFDHNRAMAQQTAILAGARLGRPVSDAAVTAGVRACPMAGRAEVMPTSGPMVILDGAHNPEKLTVAVSAALKKRVDGPRVCLFGVLGAKAGPEIAAPLSGKFDFIIATEPSVYAKRPSPAGDTAALFSEPGCPVVPIADATRAFDTAISVAGSDGMVLVTGSFYLLAAIRERYYPKAQIVLQRSYFPNLVLEK
jgi:dihydrofolate synthase / folylpolyglutamate synthase